MGSKHPSAVIPVLRQCDQAICSMQKALDAVNVAEGMRRGGYVASVAKIACSAGRKSRGSQTTQDGRSYCFHAIYRSVFDQVL
jgi:hypothetical protein